ncbi:MAG: anti-sigma factor antagonist [Frankiaceae bacterium]|nr:anti-sigma factor antagonist [Frankiaceae bacterium]
MFAIETARSGRHVVLAVNGEVDVATAPALRHLLTEALTESPSIVIDLDAVPFMDSTGLGVLVGACNRARVAGSTLVLARPQPIVRNALRLVQVDTVIDVYDSLEDALAVGPG